MKFLLSATYLKLLYHYLESYLLCAFYVIFFLRLFSKYTFSNLGCPAAAMSSPPLSTLTYEFQLETLSFNKLQAKVEGQQSIILSCQCSRSAAASTVKYPTPPHPIPCYPILSYRYLKM